MRDIHDTKVLPELRKSTGRVPLSLSQTDNSLHTKTTQRGLMHHVACLSTPQLLLVLTVLNHGVTVRVQ